MLKTEITQKVKSVQSPNADPNAIATPVATPGQVLGWAKFATLVGNHRHHNSSIAIGMAVVMGIISLPENCLQALAIAPAVTANSALNARLDRTATADPYVQQLEGEVAAMPSQTQSPVIIAQAQPATANNLRTIANRTDTDSLQFGSEPSISIQVPTPRTRTFRFVPSTQAYNPNAAGADEVYHDNNPTRKPGITTLGFSWPAAGTLTSRFGRRWGRMHKGIDIAGPVGTPINAAADGIIIAAGWNSGGYGNLVEVRHSDGTTTRYGHNSRISVAVGQTVSQGQQIAEMGSTGHSTGSHLHFEIRPSGGDAVNPIALLPTNS